MEDSEKFKAIQDAIEALEKNYGKGSVMYMGESQVTKDVDVIRTGSIGLDNALGIGGVPRGRIVEIFGPDASGKTTLSLHIIANAQKNGGYAAFIDVENALSIPYAQALGVDVTKLYVSQPDSGEQALGIVESLIKSKSFDVIVIDSVAALVPKAEIEGDFGDSHMGLHARLMSQALRKLTFVISKTNTCCIFINQLREKIGVMYGDPTVTTGGRALKFYASVRIDIRRTGQITTGDTISGGRTKVKIAKNKLAIPFQTTEFDIVYGKGISKLGEIIELGVEYKIVDKSGTWYSYGETRIGHGIEKTKEWLEEHPDISDEIEAKVREKIANKVTT
jgi:recombination protein RecA